MRVGERSIARNRIKKKKLASKYDFKSHINSNNVIKFRCWRDKKLFWKTYVLYSRLAHISINCEQLPFHGIQISSLYIRWFLYNFCFVCKVKQILQIFEFCIRFRTIWKKIMEVFIQTYMITIFWVLFKTSFFILGNFQSTLTPVVSTVTFIIGAGRDDALIHLKHFPSIPSKQTRSKRRQNGYRSWTNKYVR